MKCLLCQGEMEKKTVPYSVDRRGYHLYVREIPAYVCTQCGEKYFDEVEINNLQEIIHGIEERLEKLNAA
jgi:YgiT-type zinc finger domain-containing protein